MPTDSQEDQSENPEAETNRTCQKCCKCLSLPVCTGSAEHFRCEGAKMPTDSQEDQSENPEAETNRTCQKCCKCLSLPVCTGSAEHFRCEEAKMPTDSQEDQSENHETETNTICQKCCKCLSLPVCTGIAKHFRREGANASPDSQEDQSENHEAETNTICQKCCKCLSIGVVVLIFMASLCSAQIFMFHLSMRLGVLSNTNRSANGTNSSSTSVENDKMEATRIYIIIVLAIITPYLFNFLRALLIILGTTDIRWPNGRMFLWGLLSAVLESVGVALLVLYTFTFYNGVVCSLIICCISVLPSIVLMALLARDDPKACRIAATVLSSTLHVAGTVCMVIWMITVTHTEYDLRWIQPCIAVVLLWFAWMSPLQKCSVEFSSVTKKKTAQGSEKEHQRSEGIHSSDNSDNKTPLVTSKSEGEKTVSELYCRKTEAAWEMALISNLAKALFVIIVAVIIFFKGNLIYSSDTSSNLIWEEFILAWKLNWTHDVKMYTILITSSIVAHGISLFLCHISKSILLFLFPAYFSNVFILLILWNSAACNFFLPETPDVCGLTMYPRWAVITATVTLALAALSLLLVLGVGSKHVLLRSESQIVWLPSLSSVAPGVWTILNKRMWPLDMEQEKNVKRQETAKIFICTTMYRENRKEMTQLLKSFKNISNSMKTEDCRRYVFHIVVDDGARGNDLTKFSLQLLSLITPILGISVRAFTKIIEPYGIKLELKTKSSFNPSLNIHFKDNDKVKKKKRWSQIMYMEFIINYLQQNEGEAKVTNGTKEDRYILTTDADVWFTRNSVETLVDLMIRDKSVGAVTGRIHPAGSGPCVWYQVFEYAIGHWLQKTAEHKLGSLLCAPGCFSLFRSDALKTVLSRYSSDVSCGFDFLTKDMGEDRWLCTLLIQTGWKVQYCAASNNTTFCPVTFGELYKQRRRWVASTLANMWLLMKDYKKLLRPKQKRVSFLFLLYQGTILCSSLIGPSTVIIFVAGGLQLAWGINPILSIVVQSIICLGYVILCLNKSLDRRHQISVARCITLFYGVVMAAVAVGTIKSIVHEVALPHEEDMIFNIPVSATTIYVITLVGIFIFTSVLHWDLSCLFYGIFYFLCIPSGYLVLTIYSLCNITDRSWGTREATVSNVGRKSLLSVLWMRLAEAVRWMCKHLQACCRHGHQLEETERQFENLLPNTAVESVQQIQHTPSDVMDVETWLNLEFGEQLQQQYSDILRRHGYENTMFLSQIEWEDFQKMGIVNISHMRTLMTGIERLPTFKVSVAQPNDVKEWLNTIGLAMYECGESLEPSDIGDKTKPMEDIAERLQITTQGHTKRLEYALNCVRHPNKDTAVESVQQIQHTPSDVMDVDTWLNLEFGEQLQQQYSDILRRHGYENTMFLSQIEWEDFQKMGIVNISHMRTLMTGIERLPTFKVSVAQPNDVKEWLNTIGLAMYECGESLEPSDICDKTKPMEDIAERLQITTQGHTKRLEYALNCVRHPNKVEDEEQKTKVQISLCTTVDYSMQEPGEEVEDISVKNEYEFWKGLIQKCLDPKRETNTNNKELKAELVRLRNRWLQVLAVSNVIWLIFIVTLASHAELTVLGINAIGFILLGIYIFVVMIQFGAMLFHRGHTLIHVLARTSMFCHPRPGGKCCDC